MSRDFCSVCNRLHFPKCPTGRDEKKGLVELPSALDVAHAKVRAVEEQLPAAAAGIAAFAETVSSVAAEIATMPAVDLVRAGVLEVGGQGDDGSGFRDCPVCGMARVRVTVEQCAACEIAARYEAARVEDEKRWTRRVRTMDLRADVARLVLEGRYADARAKLQELEELDT